MERKANREKPRTKTVTLKSKLKRYFYSIGLGSLILVQLVGFTILPFPHNPILQTVGFFLVLLGKGVSFTARITLGTNWTDSSEYQIKKKHDLITTGIYHYIRHPIYLGITLAATGAELVAQSYLFLPLFILLSLMNYRQGRLEEKLLVNHFGKDYEKYMKQSKMLIPFVV